MIGLSRMKIVLLMPRGDYESTPCVKSLAEELAVNGIEVNVLTIRNEAFPVPEVEERKNKVSIIYCPLIRQRSFWENVPLITGVFSLWAFYHLIITKYDYAIFNGVRALYMSGLFGLISKTKIVYNSLELYISHEITSPLKKIFKRLESFLNRRVDLSIIQDAQRASILVSENGINRDSVLLFPNSTRGSAIGRSAKARLDLLVKYSLPEESKIIIYSGSFFAPWGMVDELLRSVESWPRDWYLLLHSRTKSNDVKMICEDLSLDISENLILSNEPLTNKEYEHLVQGCDVGLALYDGSVSDNIKYVGLSSGKLAQYLKYGLPILVNELPMWKDIISDYKCGETILADMKMHQALNKIFADYESYQKGAVRVFDSTFSLKNYTPMILEALCEDNK